MDLTQQTSASSNTLAETLPVTYDTVSVAVKGSETGVTAMTHILYSFGLFEIGDWSLYQPVPDHPNQVITLSTKRFRHQGDEIQLLKSTQQSGNRSRRDPVFLELDRQFYAIWAEHQWEAEDGGNWVWDDAARAILYQSHIDDHQLGEIDRLKVELWKLLGGFEVHQPPTFLAA